MYEIPHRSLTDEYSHIKLSLSLDGAATVRDVFICLSDLYYPQFSQLVYDLEKNEFMNDYTIFLDHLLLRIHDPADIYLSDNCHLFIYNLYKGG